MAWQMFRRFRRLDKVSSSSSLSDSEINVEEVDTSKISKNKLDNHKNELDTTVNADVSSTTLNKPSVSFSAVEIRRYKLIVGDNPYCEIPLGLDWDHDEEAEVIGLDDYENGRRETRPGYTYAQYMEPLDVAERLSRLRSVGYTNEQIRIEERRRRVALLLEWTYRQNREEAVVFTAPNGAHMFKKYIM